MVDIDTALRSAAIDGRKAKRQSDGSKPRRAGGSVGLEPFDPLEFKKKEVADTYSMWLVIVGSISLAFIMRYFVMPNIDGPSPILWLLPLSFVFALPSLHRLIIPSEFSDLYTGGNWFRSGMLWLFTWLSVSIVLVNPPLADISAPEITNASILFDDGPEAQNLSNNFLRSGTTIEITIDGSSTQGDMWLVLGVRDNINLQSCSINISMVRSEEILLETTFNVIDSNESVDFLSIQSLNSSIMSLVSDPLDSRNEDVGVAIEIGALESGTYSLSYSVNQNADPWYLSGTSGEYIIKIIND
ncbi:MAG: hypothetical protein CMB31_07650 [Euryarchaeota archaeon]|nr:hypothetical protein [Euryarchaeota archaeon]|tara:strand:- start:9 stop:908 length:900 start_codon:yes stop_codon:yes gene_type:complete